jgi:hypothetical protein
VQEIAPFPVTRGRDKTISLSPDQKRALVQRVVSSQVFSRAPALRAFLVYITDHAISGQTDKLKEQAIGAEVLGRKPNYDPADDNIVRVRAHELRERLARYFASEGSAEPIVVTIPRGAYAPEFAPRESAPAERPAAPVVSEIARESAKTAAPSVWRWAAVPAVLLVAVCASVVLTRFAVKNESRTVAEHPDGAMRDFWGQFFNTPNEELKVVYSDPGFALWQDLTGKSLNLGEYLNHKYLTLNQDKFFDVAARRVTSPADIAISTHIGVLTGEFGGQANLRFARDASAEFLRYGNTVLIGSHRSDPWVEIYEPSLNFQLAQDPHSNAPAFLNRSPQQGETAMYSIPAMFDTQRTEEKEFTSYGVVALLKGCGNRGMTVLLEGLNMQATQAVGDLVTDPQRLDGLLKSIGHKPGTTVAPFEALIQITSLPAEYDNPRVVAYRLRHPESCVGN